MKTFKAPVLVSVIVAVAITGTLTDASDDKASLDAYRKMQLEKHNKFRATHKSPLMSLDNKLNQDAQAHAEKLAAKGKWLSQEDHDKNRGNQGENIGIDCHSNSHQDYNEVTDRWYSEEKNWDYKTGDTKQICKQNPVPKSCPENGQTGHFTQVVWKGSVKLGIGKATGKVFHDGRNWFCTWAVGRYSPAGNVEGSYTNNVFKPMAPEKYEFQKTSKMVSVPRTLTDLIDGFIESLKGQYEDVYKNLDTLIAKDRWMIKFQEYLQNRDLDEEVQKLHFVVLAEIVFKYQNLIDGDKDKNSANQKEKLKREQRDLFNYIIRTFFSEDPISLSNQALIKKLSDYADTQNITTEMIDDLEDARDDSHVWSDCLEKDYMKFLKQINTTRSAMAYLLSIL